VVCFGDFALPVLYGKANPFFGFIIKKRVMKNAAIFYLTLCSIAFILIAGCKKGGTSTGNSPTPPSTTATQGQAVIYLKQDCNVGNVTVTINNVNKLISGYSSYAPDCDQDSTFAIYSLDPGTYKVNATAGNLGWTGSFTVTAGQCTAFYLSCDGVVQALTGTPGNPRFNLQHSTGVDFDLHLMTPDNSVISSYTTSGQGGKMDLSSNCLGSDTSPGIGGFTQTTENIYWLSGTAPHGTYQFWVQYSNYCGSTLIPGNYTLRVMNGLTTLKTYTGTLNASTTKSATYTFVY
jgi:hypothetical protein